ncbi:hypothetical protein GIB67_013782, partial [Kingdonia uniflora]
MLGFLLLKSFKGLVSVGAALVLSKKNSIPEPIFDLGASSCTCPEAGSSISMSFFSPRGAKGGSPSLNLKLKSQWNSIYVGALTITMSKYLIMRTFTRNPIIFNWNIKAEVIIYNHCNFVRQLVCSFHLNTHSHKGSLHAFSSFIIIHQLPHHTGQPSYAFFIPALSWNIMEHNPERKVPRFY